MGNLDWTAFHWVNRLVGQHAWLDSVGKWLATALALVIVLTLAGGWLFLAGRQLSRKRELSRELLVVVLVVATAVVLGLVGDQLIGHVWFRPRPYVAHDGVRLLTSPSSDPSFPSDHVTAGFAISLGAASRLPRLAVVLLTETFLMGVGRVYVGLHYPGDILGSLAVGATAALLAWWLVRRADHFITKGVSLLNGYASDHGWQVRLR